MSLYRDHLRVLWGCVVPFFYGEAVMEIGTESILGLVLEYFDGTRLRSLSPRDMDSEASMFLIKLLFKHVGAISAQNVVWGDDQSTNILVRFPPEQSNDQVQVRLIDFGFGTHSIDPKDVVQNYSCMVTIAHRWCRTIEKAVATPVHSYDPEESPTCSATQPCTNNAYQYRDRTYESIHLDASSC